tara:strand:- start:112 stop:1005 length:894 start_codon:yes stop_codon:yes gene_type:complete
MSGNNSSIDWGQVAQGAAGAAGTGAIGAIFGIGSRRKAYHRSKKLMDKQFAMDKQMFDYQNAYNTPAAQMARLKAAGLNPALMYGQGTTGNASGYPQSKFTELSPYFNAADFAQSAAAGTQMTMVGAMRKEKEATTALTKAKAVIDGALGSAITENKKAYIDGLLAEWQTARTKNSLLELEKTMKDNGIGNWTIASALTFLTGEKGHTIDLQKKVLKGSGIAKFLGMDDLTYGQAIIAGIGMVKAGTWTIDKFATLFTVMRSKKMAKSSKKNTRIHTRKDGKGNTITNKSEWINDNY